MRIALLIIYIFTLIVFQSKVFAITAMESHSANLNFNLIMADIMKDYKQLSANFIEDNDSISSIPSNLASLQSRHIKWVRSIEQIFSQNKINFNSIKDSVSYLKIIGQINTIADNLPNDSGLSKTETKFISDLVRVRDELATIKVRIDNLLSDALTEKAFACIGINYSKVKTNFFVMSAKIEVNMQDLDNIRSSITNQQLIRKKIKNYTVTLWKATASKIADKALDIQNIRDANDLIMQMKRSLTSPLRLAKMKTELNRLDSIAEDYFSTYDAPLLARRSVYTYQQSVLDYQIKINTSNDIDPIYKRQMQFEIDTASRVVRSFFVRVKEEMRISDQYLKQRKKNVQTRIKILESQNKKLTPFCQSLADTILNEIFATTTVISEANYVEFYDNCWNDI